MSKKELDEEEPQNTTTVHWESNEGNRYPFPPCMRVGAWGSVGGILPQHAHEETNEGNRYPFPPGEGAGGLYGGMHMRRLMRATGIPFLQRRGLRVCMGGSCPQHDRYGGLYLRICMGGSCPSMHMRRLMRPTGIPFLQGRGLEPAWRHGWDIIAEFGTTLHLLGLHVRWHRNVAATQKSTCRAQETRTSVALCSPRHISTHFPITATWTGFNLPDKKARHYPNKDVKERQRIPRIEMQTRGCGTDSRQRDAHFSGNVIGHSFLSSQREEGRGFHPDVLWSGDKRQRYWMKGGQGPAAAGVLRDLLCRGNKPEMLIQTSLHKNSGQTVKILPK
uniref:Uncharacterized protein n=1 Tax=Branchiostoma floridae TaxID=7739 RepID=C3YV03_BRAFL|eukprot:XP_002599854.1 hypothetical protein BRAFLDRAFT_95544 [Branchiostoma floridae]